MHDQYAAHPQFERITTRQHQFAYGILRAFFGVCFLAHAVILLCFGKGLPAVVNHMQFALAETHLPQNLITVFGFSMPLIDLAIAAALMLGIGTLPAIMASYGYLCLLLTDFALDTDFSAMLVTIAAALGLAFLLVGRRRFDRPWHVILFRPSVGG